MTTHQVHDVVPTIPADGQPMPLGGARPTFAVESFHSSMDRRQRADMARAFTARPDLAIGSPLLVREAPRPADPLPVFGVTVVDAAAAKALDPLLATGAIVPLWASPAVPLALLAEDGTPILTLDPIDAGTPAAGDLSLAVYEVLLAQHGAEDTGETSDAWTVDGMAAMRHALAGAEMLRGGLRGYRGEGETRTRQAEAVGRWFGVSPETIAGVTGRPHVARRSLLPTCDMAKTLDARKLAREEEERQGAARAEAARIEAARPRTWAEIGVEGIAIRKDRVGMSGDPLEGHGAPWALASPAWVGETEIVYGWRSVRGLALPPFEVDGVRSLRGDETVPQGTHPVHELSRYAFGFLCQLREKYGTGLDLGPVTPVTPSEGTLAEARQIARAYARDIAAAPLPRLFWQMVCVELIVRGLCIDPVTAALIIAGEADHAAGRAATPQINPVGRLVDVPTRPSMKAALSSGGGHIGDGCILALASGVVSVGALLSDPTLPSNHTKKAG